ncbi:hypothetical protein ElyMa_002587700 [Elysia marginata]|uniref:Uncharacterized protein n=1 Tax=Elysia marginata TaxID=1093978 RepID=A0AAV4H1C6_9GAST|nr:hypothetical protein ElyMa_002587700 [Elysia marginata]
MNSVSVADSDQLMGQECVRLGGLSSALSLDTLTHSVVSGLAWLTLYSTLLRPGMARDHHLAALFTVERFSSTSEKVRKEKDAPTGPRRGRFFSDRSSMAAVGGPKDNVKEKVEQFVENEER